jgi:hypothetical protein
MNRRAALPRMGLLHPHLILWYKQMVRAALQGTGLMAVLGHISIGRQRLEISHHWVEARWIHRLRVALLTDLHVGKRAGSRRDVRHALTSAASGHDPDRG